MQRGESEVDEISLPKRSSIKGSQAIGILLILLAVVVYQSNALVALGVGVLGAYLALGGKIQ